MSVLKFEEVVFIYINNLIVLVELLQSSHVNILKYPWVSPMVTNGYPLSEDLIIDYEKCFE